MSRQQMLDRLRQQLALEMGCAPEDFLGDSPVFTLPCLPEGARRYSSEPDFFHMATLGRCAVLSADARLHPFLREFAAGKEGHRLFEYPNLRRIEEELSRYGYRPTQSFHMFLPDTTPPSLPLPAEVRWLTGEDFAPYYGDSRFPYAIGQPRDPRRPDVLGVAAVEGGEILGMAACSADAPDWWQIGIDVCAGSRGHGLGAGLVALLKEEILRRGKLPFYGTSLSNLASWRTALRCGFFPAWIEVSSRRIEG